MRYVGSLILILILCASCAKKYEHKGKTPLVELDGKFLYQEDLQRVLPIGLSKADSLAFVEQYIQNWAEETLLYDIAMQNIPDNEEIERLVESYQQALILHAYQQELMHQKLASEITESEMRSYFDQHQTLFTLEKPLMKGLFMKIPLKAPQLANVKRWYKSDKQEDIESLEKYSLQYAVKYEYFHDKWLPVDEILDWMPVGTHDLSSKLAKEQPIELKDTAYHYFLDVSNYLEVGEPEPFEYAQPQIMAVLQSLKQTDFMKKVKSELYEQALIENRIINLLENKTPE